MFELKEQQVKITSVNARAEMHGDQPKPAFDLKCEVAVGNDALIDFHPELRAMLYKKNDAPDLVDQVEPDALTALRFPKLGPIKWDFEGRGYSVRVAYGIGGPSDIRLGDVKVDGLRLTPQQGGTVLVAFRVIAHPATDDVGRLCELIQQTIEMDVTAPEPATVQELFGDEQKAA